MDEQYYSTHPLTEQSISPHSEIENAILNAAADVFLENGYGRTSLYDLSQRSGVSETTIEDSFTTKESIFRLVVDREMGVARAAFRNGVPRFASAIEATRFVIQRHLFVVMQTRVIPLARIVVAEAHRHPEIADTFRTQDGQDQTQALGEFMLSTWIDQGLFKPCRVSFAIRQLYGMVNQALIIENEIIDRDIDALEEYLEACAVDFCERYGV